MFFQDQYPEYSQTGTTRDFMYKVYGWMGIALSITAGIAYLFSHVPSLVMAITTNPILILGIFIAQVVLVLSFSVTLVRASFSTALLLFIAYAALMGVTMSFIFLQYTEVSIYTTFLTTAGMFGTMCIYGYFTKSDLTTVGQMAFMALLGIIVASLVNIFLRSHSLDFFVSIIGVLVFTALTAYDAQKIKHMAYMVGVDSAEGRKKLALMGALTLYLDFVNLFLMLLRFFGRRRND